MCGIVFLTKKFNHKLNQTFNLLKHRGPDLENFINLDDVVIGHNLLQIRGELNSSQQPKFAKNRRYILAFNGQIYNTDELKKNFSLDTKIDLDTEILVQIIDKIGLKFIQYIKGMFAILIYDTHEKKVYLFRDPSGQKHLYYYVKNSDVVICSEIKPLCNIIENYDFDDKNLLSSLILGYPIDKFTPLKNILRVLPGEIVVIDSKKKISKNFFKQNKKNFVSEEPQRVIQNTIENHLLTKKKLHSI